MTPKEKAVELVDNYVMLFGSYWNGLSKAKKCALIAVDEILKTSYFTHEPSEDDILYCNYWQQVKEEIEKL